MTVPYTFGTATTSIPLSNLDANFNTPITLGNTSIYLGNTTTTIGNLTLTNATISSGTVNITNVTVTTANVTNITVTGTANIATGNVVTLTSTSITDSGLTSGRVTYAGASGLLQDSATLTYNGTTLSATTGAILAGTSGRVGVGVTPTLGKLHVETGTTETGLFVQTGGTTSAYGIADFRTGSNLPALTILGNGAATFGVDLTIQTITAGRGNGGAASNTVFGASALTANSSGNTNSAFGSDALKNTNTGYANAAFGGNTLTANTSGYFNCALGTSSLNGNISGANNTAAGYQALFSNTTASNNTAVGYQAGFTNTVGQESTYIGGRAGYSTTGGDNTFVGYNSGNTITSGYANTILGKFTGNNGGLDIRTANNYIVLSDGSGNPRGIFDGSGNFLIGTTNTAHTSAGFTVEAGGVPYTTRGSGGTLMGFYNLSAATIGSITNSSDVAVLYNTTSDQRLKTNIVDAPSGNIDEIKVRSFNWVANNSHQEYGMVAQELLEVAPYAVHQPTNPDEMMAVDYSKLVPMMIKEIQDLKARLTALESK
jgi:hypothetical protein